MMDAACRLCGDKQAKQVLGQVSLASDSVFALLHCPQCGLSYVDPLPSAQELQKFYSADYFNFDQARDEGKGMAFARRLRKIQPGGRFLDIGCATGFFINGIRQACNWQVYGIEFSESASAFAREQLGLEVKTGELCAAGYPGAFFDYIHVNNVLEHVSDPRGFMLECRRILKPGGRLLLSVPNGANDRRELIDFYHQENLPARSKEGHLYFFSAKTLRWFFPQMGFDIQRCFSYSVKRGLRNLGLLPKKNNWKDPYYPRHSQAGPAPAAIRLNAQTRRRPFIYYLFRLWQGDMKMIPGLHAIGLDFLFVLRSHS